ncbi:flagellar basal body rod protein FlgC [Myxococcota bacterium]|nr:flagellar basal body rod protein FlgC [Myxococcota bacterium]MBU1429659.1 flagellar basal body rod protein FlgC [Myxococcota bacterium]MBU1898120.1 flagellar basal body rod protein FlgC [Myxococcota bacterium]
MDFFTAMRAASAGLTVQRTRVNLTSSNLANAETTRTPEGGPYRRRAAVIGAIPLREQLGEVFGDALHDATHSAEVVAVSVDERPGQLRYDPDHPDANAEGYVTLPNVNPITEMVDLLSASRSYEANTTALKAIKGMATDALSIGER